MLEDLDLVDRLGYENWIATKKFCGIDVSVVDGEDLTQKSRKISGCKPFYTRIKGFVIHAKCVIRPRRVIHTQCVIHMPIVC